MRTNYQYKASNSDEWQERWGSYSPVVEVTIPRVEVTSASYNRSTEEIEIDWSLPVDSVGGTTDWWYFITRGTSAIYTSQGYALVNGLVVADSPDTRSVNVPLPGIDDEALRRTIPGPLYVFIVTGTELTEDGTAPYYGSYGSGRAGAFSRPFEVDWGLSTCTDRDVTTLGNLTGYGRDFTGDLARPACTVMYEDTLPSRGTPTTVGAEIFRFDVSETRSASFTLTPSTPFASNWAGPYGNYKVRVRSVGIDGTVVGSAETSLGNQTELVLDTVTISSGFQYVVEVMRKGILGGYDWSLNVAYGHIEPATPTPAPTPTPRALVNQDFRLHPNPSLLTYEEGQVYPFDLEGDSSRLPVVVRTGNPAALTVGASSSVDCNPANGQHSFRSLSATVYLRTCAGSTNSSLELLSGGDKLAEYMVFVLGGPIEAAQSETVPQPYSEDVSGRDLIGLTLIVAQVCGGAGVSCDAKLVKDLVVAAVAAIAAATLLNGARRRASTLMQGIALGVFILVLMLGWRVAGFPLWISLTMMLFVFALAALAAWTKASTVRV